VAGDLRDQAVEADPLVSEAGNETGAGQGADRLFPRVPLRCGGRQRRAEQAGPAQQQVQIDVVGVEETAQSQQLQPGRARYRSR
jgi:hypothetical protein